jgi:glutamyl-Q tRNA(Asp) synthetase
VNKSPSRSYIGRFAPSPTGPLHAGSLVAALASYLDARANGGAWLIRIEDIDEGRSVPGAADTILAQLAWLGMHSDAKSSGRAGARTCTRPRASARRARLWLRLQPPRDRRFAPGRGAGRRGDLSRHLPPRPGAGTRGAQPAPARAGAGEDTVGFIDRFAGTSPSGWRESGDFVLKRADGYWAYQLAVVVDDAEQGVTDVVRGADLLDSTPRQIYLQRLLGVPTPRYLHVPVVRNANGEKLSKQTGAMAIAPGDEEGAVAALRQAAGFLGLHLGPAAEGGSLAAFWQEAVPAWAGCLPNAALLWRHRLALPADLPALPAAHPQQAGQPARQHPPLGRFRHRRGHDEAADLAARILAGVDVDVSLVGVDAVHQRRGRALSPCRHSRFRKAGS